VGCDVLVADEGEGVEDVPHIGFVDAVEVEERRVEFAAKLEPTLIVPDERVAGVTGRLDIRFSVVSAVAA
jgi:hypothetical protein